MTLMAKGRGEIRFHIKVFTDAHPAVKLTSNSKLCTARSSLMELGVAELGRDGDADDAVHACL